MTAQTNFRAQDMLGSKNDRRSGARKSTTSEPNKPEPAQQTAPAQEQEPRKTTEPRKTSEQDPNKVPEGTSEEVVAWVGNDPSRARKALAAEKKSGEPRDTVTDPLNKVLEDDRQAKKTAAAQKKAASEKQGE